MVIYLNVTEPFFAPKAISDQDRAAIGAVVDPVYSELKKKFDVKQVQFHLPPATSFYRAHKPGDFKSFAATVIEAI